MTKKRSNGTGSLKKRANGTWQISVMVGRKPDGKRNIKYFSGRTQAEARKKMEDYMTELKAGMNMEADYTVSEWGEVFLGLHAANIKPVTHTNYMHTLKLINSHIGTRKIKELKPMDVELLLLQLREEGRSDSAISQVRGFLYMMFERAVGNDLIMKNIVQYAPKLRKRAPEEREIFSAEEVSILLQALPDTKIGNSIRILVGCGLRTQELLCLRKEDIEPDGSIIYIRYAVSMVNGTAMVSTPKSFASYRNVPVPSNLRHSAMALRDTEGTYIWRSPVDNKPINPSTFRKYYKETLKSIPGVRYLSPHACRHTCVSILHAQGVDPYTLQSILGHTTQEMTHHYTHVHPDTQKEAVERFAKAFAASGENSRKKSLDELISEVEKVRKDQRISTSHYTEHGPR